jgi:hypothetical protein
LADEHAINELVEILNTKDARAYFVKFIDRFFALPEPHQKGILEWVVESVGGNKWERLLEDPFRHMTLVKMILFHYSGNEDREKEPNASHLAALIEGYMESPGFSEAEMQALGLKKKKSKLIAGLEGVNV